MAIKLTWICDNENALISLYKSEVAFDFLDLPDPIATHLIDTYIDNEEKARYYLVSSLFEDKISYSDQVSSENILSGIFILGLDPNYVAPEGGEVIFIGDL